MKTATKNYSLDADAKRGCESAQELIYQVLEHISAGRFNEDLVKQKLIQAVKDIPTLPPLKFSKYN